MKINKWKGNTKLHGIFSIFNYNFWFANMCEKYQVRGEYCSPFDEMNGHCSCGPGLSCIYYSAPPPKTYNTHARNKDSDRALDFSMCAHYTTS